MGTAAGADLGLEEGARLGLFAGPRLHTAARPLTQTGGHADFRPRTLEAMGLAPATVIPMRTASESRPMSRATSPIATTGTSRLSAATSRSDGSSRMPPSISGEARLEHALTIMRDGLCHPRTNEISQ